jgi:hypothetical protein
MLGEQNAPDIPNNNNNCKAASSKSSCTNAAISHMPISMLITELLVNLGGDACAFGAPDCNASADFIEPKPAFEPNSVQGCKRRLFDDQEWSSDTVGGTPSATIAGAPTPPTNAAGGRKKQLVKKAALSHENTLEILIIIRSSETDSVKTSCLAAVISKMSRSTLVTELLVDLGRWNKARASFDGPPDWEALAHAIESKAFEPSAA